jgi:hypothetical protein
MNGLFCANFAHARECWTPCCQVWCGVCYCNHPLDRFPRFLPVDEGGFDWRPVEDTLRHTHARDGDHLITPFQCDTCVFRNLQRRNPLPSSLVDDMLLCCIRRINLDAMWGREPSTVASTLRAMGHMVKMWARVGLSPAFPPLGPYPVADSFGFAVAISMVMKSLEPGKYASHQQFETIRKLRAAYSNVFMASLAGTGSLRTVGGDRAKYFLTDSPTQSLFFERFSRGCLCRMGQIVKQDWAIPLSVVHALLDTLESDWRAAQLLGWKERELISMLGAYVVTAFCGSFRGNEVFLADMFGTAKYLRATDTPENTIIVPLLGRFKGETGERYHLTPLAAVTSSGIQVKTWLSRLVELKTARGYVRGPLFGDDKGLVVRAKAIELELMERLQGIKDSQPGLIPSDVDIYEDFGISRSFRRGATSTARIRGVDDKYVNLINRWRNFEEAKGRRPTLSMQDHYSDIQILLPELMKFSLAL